MRGRVLIVAVVLVGSACGGKAPPPVVTQPETDPLETKTAHELFERGQFLVARGDYIRAEEYLVAAQERGHPSDEVVPVLLDACIRGRRYQSALNYANAELRKVPDNWRLRFVVGTLHVALGDHENARTEFERVIAGDPKLADAHYSLGMLLWKLGEREQGKVLFEQYLALEPSGAHAVEAKALLSQARRGTKAKPVKRTPPQRLEGTPPSTEAGQQPSEESPGGSS